jgi:hypothetical protein
VSLSVSQSPPGTSLFSVLGWIFTGGEVLVGGEELLVFVLTFDAKVDVNGESLLVEFEDSVDCEMT